MTTIRLTGLTISKQQLRRTINKPHSIPTAATTRTATTMSSPVGHRRLGMIDHHLTSHKPRSYSSSPTPPKQPSVLTKTDGNLRSLTLNRPEALNALNMEMIQDITTQLLKWENSPAAKIVILKGVGRAFCAGGDVVSLIKLAESEDSTQQKKPVEFFRAEYTLDSFIAKMSTPVVCLLDGITMGGGMGLSMHTPFRIATENTRVAMPETAIGLFPDVGASFFLPRLDGELGTYLGLTGTSLYGWGAFQAGIASHYVPSSSLAALEDRLSALSADATHERINAAIEEFAADPEEARSSSSSGSSSSPAYDLLGTKRQAIDHCFGQPTLQKIINQLEAVQDGHLFNEDPSLKNWAHQTIDLIRIRSPSSCLITLMALREGKKMSIDDCFAMEMRLAATCCDVKSHPDFVTGVKHLLVNKQKSRPAWRPSEIHEVDLSELTTKYFSNRAASSTHIVRLEGLKTQMKSYHEYPHSKYGLPSEELIKAFVTGDVKGTSGHLALTRQELLQLVLGLYNHKIGAQDKLIDVLDRRTVVKGQNQGFALKWQY
ncbi:uncharacterized protein PGTG_07395 [Puccinia graminis f. sp. tritici CRL 75-36-700-3]|uniref:3-hydroxyisobutyryl-CoA hydrolase n=1 Tax=Puccinia graminis f. sp. tritici (strain CRL 75-36-700-3 / race SCCL) TaxID=418459 RepID=E3K9S2_PUCGT|nr:uncharacterized protein PGTG_07395 [Puccinia graminis f. sp. tritici CRL 75-36-700-3]EFP81143.2 hypothetical protein PGTG_07395 [Puccinia graminis f. sp. tritici CRL 75-36-700-3]